MEIVRLDSKDIGKWWQKDAYCFAFDLYTFLFRKRGMADYIPPTVEGCGGVSHFTEDAGKTVLYTWHMSRDMYRYICAATYPAFAKNRSYLMVFLREICEKCELQNIFLKVINMSVVILETFIFLLENKHTEFFPSVATFWSYLFGCFFKHRFFREGGWETFKLSVVESARHYDQVAGHFEEGFIFTMKDVVRIQGLSYPELTKQLKSKLNNSGSAQEKVPDAAQCKPPRKTTERKCDGPALCPEHQNSKQKSNEDCEMPRIKVSTKNVCGRVCLALDSRKLSKNLAVGIRKGCQLVQSTQALVGNDQRVPPLHPGIELEHATAVASEETGGVRRKTHSRGKIAQRKLKLHKESLSSTNRQISLENEQGCSQSGKSIAACGDLSRDNYDMLPGHQDSAMRLSCEENDFSPRLPNELLQRPLSSDLCCGGLDVCESLGGLKIEPNRSPSFNSGISDGSKSVGSWEDIPDSNSLERKCSNDLVGERGKAGATACNANAKNETAFLAKSRKKNRRRTANDCPVNV